jgi:hypothetical protein
VGFPGDGNAYSAAYFEAQLPQACALAGKLAKLSFLDFLAGKRLQGPVLDLRVIRASRLVLRGKR